MGEWWGLLLNWVDASRYCMVGGGVRRCGRGGGFVDEVNNVEVRLANHGPRTPGCSIDRSKESSGDVI